MFFAVLVSSLALAIGLAMYDLVVRELQISSTTEQSQYAIYAADTAVECALYWDYNYVSADPSVVSIFATSTDSTNTTNLQANCSNQDITNSTILTTTKTATSATTNTTLNIGVTYFAQIQVVKAVNISGIHTTTIYAYGFNTSNIASPNAVERELQVSY